MKKLIVISLCAVFMLFLAGCGNPQAQFVAEPNAPKVYNDAAFGFMFTLPEQWEIVEQTGNKLVIQYPRNPIIEEDHEGETPEETPPVEPEEDDTEVTAEENEDTEAEGEPAEAEEEAVEPQAQDPDIRELTMLIYNKDPEQTFKEWLMDDYLCSFCDGGIGELTEEADKCKILDIEETSRNAYCVRIPEVAANFFEARETKDRVVVIQLDEYEDIHGTYMVETQFIELIQSIRFSTPQST